MKQMIMSTLPLVRVWLSCWYDRHWDRFRYWLTDCLVILGGALVVALVWYIGFCLMPRL